MPENYEVFTFEASAVAVAPGEFRGTALISNGDSIVWTEPTATTFPTETEARTEAEIIAPNVIDRLIDSGELEDWSAFRIIELWTRRTRAPLRARGFATLPQPTARQSPKGRLVRHSAKLTFESGLALSG
jgi:hypothetical protein